MSELTGMLEEHQSIERDTSNNPTSYDPTDAEKKTIRLVEAKFGKWKNARKRYDEKWLDYYKMFRGKQWKESRPSYRHSEVVNMVFQTIQSQVPILTDSRPKMEFLPQEPSDREIAEILNEIVEADWQKGNWLYKLTESIYDAHFYGTGLACIKWDPKANYGAGAIEMSSADPFYFFPDPSALDVNERCTGVIYAEPIDISVLKREYPKHAKFIKADLVDLLEGDKTELGQVRYKSPIDTNTILEGNSQNDLESKDEALKITLYLQSDDYDEEEKKSVGPDGQESVEYIQKLKFPKGRKIVIAGGVLVEDGSNPYDDGKFPYAKFSNYQLPREFWGISEVEQLESPQKIFNKLISFALDVMTLMGNPIWVVDTTSDVDTDNLVNRPGLVIEKAPGSEVRREEGVQLQPYVLQMAEQMRSWFDGVSGASDVSRGVSPGGITAASAITTLQEAAQTRTRQKSRNLDAYLQNIGQLYLSRVFQFRTTPSIVRLTNKENAEKYFKFHVDAVQDETGNESKVVRIRDYVENPETGQMAQGEERSYQVSGQFDVRVGTGSSLPFAKAEKSSQAFKLFELGVIDEEEVLKVLDYPNWESVLARVAQKKAEAAQAEMAAQGLPPGGLPPVA